MRSSVAAFLISLATAEIVTDDVVIPGVSGKVRYSYDALAERPCDNLLILGVGTGMKTSDYDLVSSAIAKSQNIISMVVDHNPWWLVKTSATRYANLANNIVEDLSSLLPDICSGDQEPRVLIGGHSASGQAAWNSLQYLDFEPTGFLGLDPFRLDPTDEQSEKLPALFWGFSETSCQVTADNAAKAGYQATDTSHRVFYQVDNTEKGAPTHCSFTDQGCYGSVCPASDNDVWVRKSVGDSVNRFLTAIATGEMEKSAFELEDDNLGEMTLFFGDDKMTPSNIPVKTFLRGTQKMGKPDYEFPTSIESAAQIWT